jgi:hypothetical protein
MYVRIYIHNVPVRGNLGIFGPRSEEKAVSPGSFGALHVLRAFALSPRMHAAVNRG